MSVIALCTIDLFIHESNSLKRKRQVLKSIRDRLRQKYNVSVAEVDYQDLWQRALLGVASVGSDPAILHRVLEQSVALVEGMHLAEVVDYQIEMF